MITKKSKIKRTKIWFRKIKLKKKRAFCCCLFFFFLNEKKKKPTEMTWGIETEML